MKTRFLLLSLVALPFQLFSQTWTPGTGSLYLSPTTTQLGIGTTAPAATNVVEITAPSNTYGNKMLTVATLNINGPTMKCDLLSRLGSSGSWYAIGQGAGVVGSISNMSYLEASNGETYASGGAFGLNLKSFTGSFSYKSYMSGVSGVLNGTVTTYPSNLIIAAVSGRDNIKGTGTLAGFFDGKVQVDGKIECEEIEVKNIGADYVFDNNYKLLSLREVEKYIKENKHLPGIAPASQTEQGVVLGKMTEKLLEKIEELTLHMIELQKQNDALKAKVETLSE